MKKNVLLVYPEFPVTYWSFKYALKFIKKKSTMVPLGLLTVAALLPEEYQLKLIDMNIDPLKEEDIVNADLVFISAMIVQKPSFTEIVSLCNELGVPVVAGGPYPTTMFKSIEGVDYFVLNEAEITLPEFIHDYEAGSPRHIYYNDTKPDITLSPTPRFDLVDFSHYNNVALQNSRGCPFNCEFCDIIELFGRKPRFKETSQFLRELNVIYHQGFRGSVFIVDDNFIGNKKRVKDLLRGIAIWQKENQYPFTFFTEASIDMASDDELIQLMVDAGFDMVFVGIETPDEAALASCNKDHNMKMDLLESVKTIQRAGIEVLGGFIVGFDEDKEDIFDRQVSFIQNAGIPMAMVGILSALPETQLYRRLAKEGRLKEHGEWTGNNTHNLELSFKPVMNEETLIQGYKNIISTIYSPKEYFERCKLLISRLPTPAAFYSRKVTFNDIRAFILSFFTQIFSRYSLTYLRFMANTMINKPALFPKAVEFAVKGHHLFTITKDILTADKFAAELEDAKSSITSHLLHFNRPDGTMPLHARARARAMRKITHIRNSMFWRYRLLRRDVRIYLEDSLADFDAHSKDNLRLLDHYDM